MWKVEYSAEFVLLHKELEKKKNTVSDVDCSHFKLCFQVSSFFDHEHFSRGYTKYVLYDELIDVQKVGEMIY